MMGWASAARAEQVVAEAHTDAIAPAVVIIFIRAVPNRKHLEDER